MQLYYCAACGSRLTNPDSERVRPGEDAVKILCRACALKAAPAMAAPDAAAIHADAAGTKSTLHTPSTGNRSVSPKPRTAELRTRNSVSAAPAATAHSSGRASKTSKIPPPPGKGSSSPGAKSNALIYASVAVLAMAVGLFAMSRSNAKPEIRVAQTDPPSTVKPGDKPIAKAVPEPPRAEPQQQAAQKSEPSVKPAETFNPKEDYERRMREAGNNPTPTAAVKTNEPAQPPAPAPVGEGSGTIKLPLPAYTADDPNWHLIFNGKDTSGWVEHKGHFVVENGELVHETASNGAIESIAFYSDFDLNCKMFMQGKLRFGEINIRSLNWVYSVKWPELGVWRDVRISARGNSVKATVDGEEIPTEDPPGTRLSGSVGFYCKQGGELKVKDVAIRVFTK